jgi:hypothetical protein
MLKKLGVKESRIVSIEDVTALGCDVDPHPKSKSCGRDGEGEGWFRRAG